MAQRGSDVRRASMSEVDVALTELAEERDDRREHNRPADNRYADGLDPAWNDALLAIIGDEPVQ